jgi:hypothetical protein
VNQLLEGIDRLARLAPLYVQVSKARQKPEVSDPQFGAERLGPRRIWIVGEQVAGVELERRANLVWRSRLHGRAGSALEGMYIDSEIIVIRQDDDVALASQDGLGRYSRRSKLTTRLVERLTQIIEPGVDVEIRPEGIDELFALQAMGGFERQQFDDLRRSTLAPCELR